MAGRAKGERQRRSTKAPKKSQRGFRGGNNKGRKFPACPPTAEEIARMVDAVTAGATGTRNKALLRLLQRSGLRVSELVRLLPDDVTATTVRVVGSKRYKSRTVGLEPQTAELIAEWKAIRKARGIKSYVPLFCSLKGEGLSTNAVRELLKRLAKKAEVTRRLSPHQFRHHFSVALARSGVVRLDEIQEALSHERLDTTARYLASLGGLTAVESIRNVRWD
jgi:site-specific recombinase XerD